MADPDPAKGRAARSRTVIAAERRAKAVGMRRDGHTYNEIGTAMGVSRQAAAELVHKALLETMTEPAQEVRQLEVERYDEMFRIAWREMHTDHVVLYQGQVVKDDEGNKLVDSAPKLAAMDRLIKIAEQRAKLLGLNAPVSVNLSTDALTAELLSLARELGMPITDIDAELSELVNQWADSAPPA
jgi:hypothetical protein